MLKGDRIAARIQALGISQAALGRALGISQQAVGKLVKGTSRNTAHLMRLARELRTSPEYLLGEIDDPEEGALAPPPAPTIQHVTMQVAMPSEAALARMFEGLLRPLDRTAPVDELARILAQRLPNGLARLATALPPEATALASAPDVAPPPLATDHPASQRGSHT